MSSYKTGDLVWAKMKGFPPWPGLITDPPNELMETLNTKKNTIYHCIYFFGTKNYSWIENEKLKAYLPHKEELSSSTKSMKFRKAVKDIEEFSKKHTSSSDMDSEADSFEELLDTTNSEKSEKEDVRETTFIEEQHGVTIEKLFEKLPSIKLHKIDLSALDMPKESKIKKKRILSSPIKKITKKKKVSNYTDADTTTPIEMSILCESPFNEAKSINEEDDVIKCSSDIDKDENAAEPSDVAELSDTTDKEDITSSDLKIGFLGYGIMGKALVSHLRKAGHMLTLWNRSEEVLHHLKHTDGIKIVGTPGEVVADADIIFCCVADSTATKDVMFKTNGALPHLNPFKSYIDITSCDVETSIDLYEATFSQGSRYLEVRLQGSQKEAEEGTLVCLAAGEESLYKDCSFFFRLCSSKSFFMGEAGNASRMQLVIQLMKGVTLAGLAESMALADRAGVDQTELLKILEISQINCPLIMDKAKAMADGNFIAQNAIKHLQSDMRYALTMGDINEQPTPLAATANELFKHAKKLGYGDHDVAAVFLGAKF